ncbi:hypothetical protein Tco_1504007 [Tanacetum coccineum]
MLQQPYLSLDASKKLWWLLFFFLNWLYLAFSTATSVSVMALDAAKQEVGVTCLQDQFIYLRFDKFLLRVVGASEVLDMRARVITFVPRVGPVEEINALISDWCKSDHTVYVFD